MGYPVPKIGLGRPAWPCRAAEMSPWEPSALALDRGRQVLGRRLEDRVALEAHGDLQALRAADLALGERDRLGEGALLAQLGVARGEQRLALLDPHVDRAGAGALGVDAARDLYLALDDDLHLAAADLGRRA